MRTYLKKTIGSLFIIFFIFGCTTQAKDSAINYEEFINKRKIIVNISEIKKGLSRERGMTVFYMMNYSDKSIQQSLQNQRNIVDKYISSYSKHMRITKVPSKLISFTSLINTRKKIDAQTSSFTQTLKAYQDIEQAIDLEIESLFSSTKNKKVDSLLTSFINFQKLQTDVALERDIVTFYVGKSKKIEMENIEKLKKGIDPLNYDNILYPKIKIKISDMIKDESNADLFGDIEKLRLKLMKEGKEGSYSVQASQWFQLLSEQLNFINEIEYAILDAIYYKVEGLKQ